VLLLVLFANSPTPNPAQPQLVIPNPAQPGRDLLLQMPQIMREPKIYSVYILSSRSRALYIGVTSDLLRRIHQHRTHAVPGHTARYRINRLVYFETTEDVHAAIEREKTLKGLRREKKIRLIDAVNPRWDDLASEWFGAP
jgi:putative endonuclease